MIFPITPSYYKAEIFNDRYHKKTYRQIAKRYKVSDWYISEKLRYGGDWNQEFREFTEIMNRYYARNITNPGEEKPGEHKLKERKI